MTRLTLRSRTRSPYGAGALTVCIAMFGPATPLLQAQDYPQWRGSNRDGSASAFVAPPSWPETLTRKWKVTVGEGYATPIVVGTLVFAFSREGGDEVLRALETSTGQVVWRTAYAAPYTVGSASAAHGPGPKATPTYAEGKIFTLGISGILSAFDVSGGRLLWQTPAPAEHPYYGVAASPLVESGVVFAHPGNYGPLTALDANTGKIRWTWPGDVGGFASPIIVSIDGVRQIVSQMDRAVVSVSMEGQLLWQYPWGRSLHITPLSHDGRIIVGGNNMGVTALSPLRRDGKWSVGVAWETKEVSVFLSNPVIAGGALYGLSQRAGGQFFALDVATGATLWLGPPREATNTAVVKASGLLFLLNDDAELVIAHASKTGFEPIKRYRVAESATWAQPAISGNRVFVKDVSSLALFEVR